MKVAICGPKRLVLVQLISLLAGCSGSSEPESPSEGVTEQTSVGQEEKRLSELELRELALNDNEMVIHTNSNLSDIEQKLASSSLVSKGNATLCASYYTFGQKLSSEGAVIVRNMNRARVWGDFAQYLGYGDSLEMRSDDAVQTFMRRFREETSAISEDERTQRFIIIAEKCENLGLKNPALLEAMAFIDSHQKLVNQGLCTPENSYCSFHSKKPSWIRSNENISLVETPTVEFPYLLVIRCGDDRTVPSYCFYGNVKTEIELRNGGEYNMYSADDLVNNRKLQYKEKREKNGDSFFVYEFPLRKSFELKAQNASDYYLLNVKITDQASGNTLFEKSVAQYGVVAVSN
jgi:hypothetical protein